MESSKKVFLKKKVLKDREYVNEENYCELLSDEGKEINNFSSSESLKENEDESLS